MPTNREVSIGRGRAETDATGEMGDDDLEAVVGGASPPETKTPMPFGFSTPAATDDGDVPLPSL